MVTYFFAPGGMTKSLWGVLYPEWIQTWMRASGVGTGVTSPTPTCRASPPRAGLVAHIHRGPYRTLLPGTPTIRMFEALACGACLVSTPWDDAEGLFRPGDYVHLPPATRKLPTKPSLPTRRRAPPTVSGDA